MKIGIMTFWWSEDNYGQQLQAYALQKYLRDAGQDAFLIRYNPVNDYRKKTLPQKIRKGLNPKKFWAFIARKINRVKNNKEKVEHPRCFSEFRNTYLKQSDVIYESFSQLQNTPPKADMYIVGSDQVWNFETSSIDECKNRLNAYFLNFGDDSIIRVAYAASWGKDAINQSFISTIQPLLKRFSFIGVREKSGITICDKCGKESSEWVCDPTMLLGADVYRNLYSTSNITINTTEYILLYMLSNENNFNIKRVFEFAEKKHLKVLYVTGNGVTDSYKKIYPTILEWLYLVDNAKYVITNSFHCCVFSTLFNKHYCAVPLTGQDKGMNNRISDLFDRFNIEDRWYTGDFSILEKEYTQSYIPQTEYITKIMQGK